MIAVYLPYIWAALIAIAVLAYVLLDGFDLGVGLLFPTAPKGVQRDIMMNTVAPVWDGNETWLVFGGGGLLAAFPLAYSIVMPALYAPIIAMLLGLVLRGVAFEFRWRTARGQFVWDFAFFAGSAIATFAQGIALGALVQGIPVVGRSYGGGWWNWLTPFSLLTGVALLIGYGVLGATWLYFKTRHTVQERARQQALVLGPALLFAVGIVSLWTPFLHAEYYAHWFAWPTMLFSFLVPILVLIAAWQFWRGLHSNAEARPFLATVGVFMLGFAGIGISFYPYMVPPSLTIVQAAAPNASLAFMLPGIIVVLPLILIYTGFAYWVFRGKVHEDSTYH
jgi:cytochrome bd ubiquinol oxidase subunit II